MDEGEDEEAHAVHKPERMHIFDFLKQTNGHQTYYYFLLQAKF